MTSICCFTIVFFLFFLSIINKDECIHCYISNACFFHLAYMRSGVSLLLIPFIILSCVKGWLALFIHRQCMLFHVLTHSVHPLYNAHFTSVSCYTFYPHWSILTLVFVITFRSLPTIPYPSQVWGHLRSHHCFPLSSFFPFFVTILT